MEPDFDWNAPLEHRQGADINLHGIDVFVEFDWDETVGHPQTHFSYGLSLARRIVEDCPADKRPALLLTDRDEVKERSFSSDRFYVMVINLPRYLRSASADAAAGYLGDAVGTGLTRLNQVEALIGSSPEEIEAFLDMKLTPGRVAEWASGDTERLSALRRIVGDGDSNKPTVSLAAAIDALEAINGLSEEDVERVAGLFSQPEGRQLVDLLADHALLPAELLQSLDHHRRCRAVEEFERMLVEDLTEPRWQTWFEENDWVLGSEYVSILGERPIDVDHIADYLMEAYDGFLDLIEIKRPDGKLHFWADARDHGNVVPHADLVKAITQASRYLFEVECQADSLKFLKRLGGVRAIKPRCVLIFGRSAEWGEDEREAYRLLNAGYHSLTILSYDHVLDRARRILGLGGD